MNIRNVVRAALFVAVAALASGCDPIEMEMILEIPEGTSSLDVTVPGAGTNTTELSGGMVSTASIEISLFDILFARPFEGDIVIDEILVAGTPFVLVGNLSTEGLCVFSGDPPGGGSLELSLLRKRLSIEAAANTKISVVNSIIRSVLGPPAESVLEVSDSVRVSLIDLLGVLGGGSLSATLEQEVDITMEVEGLGELTVVGNIVLQSADAVPSSPLLDTCRMIFL